MGDLFQRYCEININGRVLSAPPMNVSFDKSFSLAGGSQTKARIINPSADTVHAAEKTGSTYPPVIIDAGYMDDYGTVVIGEIIKTELKKGADIILDLTISDKTSLWSYAIINCSWKGSIYASDVISQILKGVGITPARIDLEYNCAYERGISFSGVPLVTAMKRLERDTKSDFFFKDGQAYFIKKSITSTTGYYLTYNTGLLSAQKSGSGFKLKTLFLYQIHPGSQVRVDGNDVYGDLKVTKGKHKFSIKGQAYTEFEAVKL